MIYREWFNLRLKLAAWLAIYGGWAVVFLSVNVLRNPMYVNIYGSGDSEIYTTLFNKWLENIAVMTPVLALLGGVDLISEEKNKGTISFMLTRPLSRTWIYITKVLLNTGVLVSVIALISLIVLVVDRLPRTVEMSVYNVPPCRPDTYCNVSATSRPIDFVSALIGLVLILLVGIVVVFNAAFLSIYCRNILQTVAAATPVVVLSYVFLLGAGNRETYYSNTIIGSRGQIFTSNLIVADMRFLLSWSTVFAIVSIGLLIWGIVVFNREEF